MTRSSRSRALRIPPVLPLLLVTAGCGGALARPDAELFPPPPRDAITFWGHACCYLDVDGFGIVTDPVFEKHLFLRTRKVAVPPPASYAGTRVILISHAHDDHLSPSTLATFPAQATVLCPEPAAEYLHGLEQTIRTMRPGDAFAIPGGRVIAVAADHPGGRNSKDAAADGRALGYVVETSYGNIYYSGDTRFSSGFEEVARTHHPSLALLNINGHLKGDDAVRAARALQAPIVLPLHYAAYGYLFFGQQKKPRSCDEIVKGLGPIFMPLELGGNLRLEALRAGKVPP
jgi:L-ascorbate metabolism protein UlaG (beta-lactamase superfamily)